MTTSQSDTGGAAPQGGQSRADVLFQALGDLLLVVDEDGQVADTVGSRARAAFVDGDGRLPWEHDPRITIGAAFFGADTRKVNDFDLNYQQLLEGVLPAELVLSQLPSLVVRGDRVFEIEVTQLETAPQQCLVRLVDITDQMDERRRAESDHEFRKVIESLMANIEASRAFFAETRWLLDQIREGDERTKLARDLHTLKGNLGCFGFDDLASDVHQAEDILASGDEAATTAAIAELRETWAEQERVFGSMFASRADKEVVLSREEYEEMVMLCMMQADYTDLLGEVQRWAMAPVSRVFERLAVQATSVGSHLGKGVQVEIEHNNVRLPAAGLQGLWSSLVHLVRNALGHGIERRDERVAAGKPADGVITMSCELDDDYVNIRFADDGRGIVWDRLKAKAEQLGLPHATHDDLVKVFFTAGVTTADSLNQNSGRGEGTAAVRAAVEELGGHLDVTSELGSGTTVSLHVPLARLATLGLLS